MIQVKNPILPGFYPDPSICRAGDTFYLVTSSFAYFPGIPVFQSRDLKNWEQIGHVLDRKSQLPLEGCGHSEGIFAPTIRYHEGTFYVITTNISGGGNFIVTAKDPAGPWSEPYWLGDDAPGIDPSLFFDEDGSCYYVGTRPNPEGVRYNGDWEIWVQRLDLDTMRLTGGSTRIWKGAMRQVIWPEGPHLYQKDGWYYVMNAEGGTGPNHSVTVARSRNLLGPYENNPNNPILTHRHLGKSYPVVYVGHADLVDDNAGNWYMVMLASRPCNTYTLMGRETFLAKVEWEEGWPVVNPGIGRLEDTVELPLKEEKKLPKRPFYDFHAETLDKQFVSLRKPLEERCCLIGEKGILRLQLSKERLADRETPSYLGVRQQHFDWQAGALLDFLPKAENECAGLAVVQSNEYHIRLEKGCEKGETFVRLTCCEAGQDIVKAQAAVPEGRLELRIVCSGLLADFYCVAKGRVISVAKQVDLRFLSTEIAGGFTGCTVGMYASSNGLESRNAAEYHWFFYDEM